MRPALGPAQDLETVRLMRDAVGPDFDLMVDAHSWWRMGDRSYGWKPSSNSQAGWRHYESRGWKSLCRQTTTKPICALKEKDIVPLASGEHEPNELRYLDLILTHAVDYVQMDVCCQGGFAMGRRIFGEIARTELKFAFHSWGTALEVIAAAHLGICWPESVVEWLEYPATRLPGARACIRFRWQPKS